MPTVPRLESTIQQARAPDLNQNTAAPDAAFGLGARAQSVAPALNEFIAKAKQNADELSVLEADRQLSQLETGLLYDEANGIYNRKGKDALSLPGEIEESFNKNASQIESTLTTDVQRRKFQEMKMRRQADIGRTVARHVSTEIKNYENQETEAYLQSETANAVLNYQDPERVRVALGRQKEVIAQFGNRNGLPAEVIKVKMQQAESDVHKQIINRMIGNGDDLGAEAYFNANKDFIAGNDIAAVEKNVVDGSIRGASQREADKITSKGLSMSQALAEAKNIENPRVRDETTERIKSEYAVQAAAKRDFEEKAQVDAANFIDQRNDLDAYIREKPQIWNSLSINQRENIKQYAQAKKSGKNIATDYQTYYDLRTLAETPATREKFLETDLMSYRNNLGDTEFKEMVKLQSGLRKGDSKAQKTLDGYRTNSQIVSDALLAIKVNPKKNPQAVASFRQAVDREVQQLQERTGKPASNQEMQSIVDNLTTEVVTKKGFFYDSKKRVFELGEMDKPDLEFNDVPKAERAKIEDSLRRNGLPVSNETVLNLYIRKLESGRN